MQTLQVQPTKIDRAIGIVAAVWGACFLLPIGLQYLCLLILMPLIIVSGRLKRLWGSWRSERFWWMSVAAFFGITLITLLLQDQYFKETRSNLWQGFRIVATLCVALCLTSQEAWRVLKSALIALSLMSLFVLGFETHVIAAFPINIQKVIPQGNEWIAMSVLLSMVVVAGLRMIPLVFERGQHQKLAMTIVYSLGALLMVLLVMNQRSAQLTLLAGLAALMLTWWRKHPWRLALSWLSVAAFLAASWMAVPQVSEKFMRGFTEIEQAQQGLVNEGSMVIRFHMYTQTWKMIEDKPFSGWGIGAWNTEWKKRIHPILHGSNMPHNDALWMGAQAGVPGMLAWLALMLSLCWMAWKQHSAAGHIAFCLAVMSLVNSLVNSGTRDATLGLPILFAVGCGLAWARGAHKGTHSPV